MPANQTTKGYALCNRLSVAAEKIMSGLEEIASVKSLKESSGVNFSDEDLGATLAGSALRHADGDNFNNVITLGDALAAFLGQEFRRDVLQAVRSGS